MPVTQNPAAIARRSLLRSLVLCTALILSQSRSSTELVFAQETVPDSPTGQKWALILVGIPGDAEHAELFTRTADRYQKWFTQTAGLPSDRVLRLPAVPGIGETPEKTNPQTPQPKPELPAQLTAERLKSTLDELQQKLAPEDSLWVLTIGHGNYDGKRAWWHLAGRDPSDEDLGRLFSTLKCREQVLILTQSSSGWFVKALSRPGRIIIASTAADDESNETEFPEALANVLERDPDKLDRNGDHQVSIAELFTAVQQEVIARFQTDKRLPTEHSQLDDDGDGQGSEDLARQVSGMMKVDGDLAGKTFVPWCRDAASTK